VAAGPLSSNVDMPIREKEHANGHKPADRLCGHGAGSPPGCLEADAALREPSAGASLRRERESCLTSAASRRRTAGSSHRLSKPGGVTAPDLRRTGNRDERCGGCECLAGGKDQLDGLAYLALREAQAGLRVACGRTVDTDNGRRRSFNRVVRAHRLQAELTSHVSRPDDEARQPPVTSFWRCSSSALENVAVNPLSIQVIEAQGVASWGWRVPFWIGGVLAIGSLLFVLWAEESDSFAAAQSAVRTVRPWRRLVEYRREFLVVFSVTMAGTIGFQTYATYMPRFLVNTAGFDAGVATEITLIALVIYTVIHPPVGWISDLTGRRKALIVFSGLGMLINVPILSALSTSRDPIQAFVLLLVGLCALAPYTAVSAIFKAELFPTEIRAFAVGLSFALPVSIFGGTSELIALSFKRGGQESLFYWYVTVAMAVSLVAALCMRPDTPAHDARPAMTGSVAQGDRT
jgi:hypothetical protein